MPSSKRQKAGARGPQPMRSRTTRSSKARLLSNPTETTQQLTQQLRALGLYAADTLGDGNCLFRALSDQLYGTPSHHLRLRQEICDWITAHKSRYEPFVEDERGFDVHLKCMRQQGTYGGHLELSAFAHYARRDVKVIQPGLVYVIEWFAGWDPSEIAATSGPSFEEPPTPVDSREKRRMKREKVRADQGRIEHPDADTSVPQRPIYVAYHDWEHFSSIRNLKGPHTGIPNVVERSGDSGPPSPVPQKGKQKPASKQPSKATTSTKRKASKAVMIAATSPTPPPPAPADIPLPLSRSPSPTNSPEPSSSSLTTALPYPMMPSINSLLEPRPYRSPKRTFDESSASSHSETSESASKRARSINPPPSRLSQDVAPPESQELEEDSDVDVDVSMVEPDADTPGLSPSGFSSESSLSPLSSPSPSPPPPEKPLTRRQRKALGLPKQRPHIVGGKGISAGKIVIPGGKFKDRKGTRKSIKEEPDDEADAEWTRNGTGRVDVRGFRELKI